MEKKTLMKYTYRTVFVDEVFLDDSQHSRSFLKKKTASSMNLCYRNVIVDEQFLQGNQLSRPILIQRCHDCWSFFYIHGMVNEFSIEKSSSENNFSYRKLIVDELFMHIWWIYKIDKTLDRWLTCILQSSSLINFSYIKINPRCEELLFLEKQYVIYG